MREHRPRKGGVSKERVVIPTEADIAWAAGFFEGEGWVGGDRIYCLPLVKISQVNPWPLERMLALFGGTITKTTKRPVGHQPFFSWSVSGLRANDFLVAIYNYLSPKQQTRIDAVISAWRARHKREDNALE